MFEYYFAVVGIISILMLMYALVLTVSLLRRGMRYRYYFVNVFIWVFDMLYVFFIILAVYSKSKLIYHLAVVFGMIIHLFLLIQADTLTSEQINPWKFGFVVGWNVFGFMKIISLDDFIIFSSAGGNNIRFGNIFWVSFCLVGMIFSGSYYSYITLQVYRKSPSHMKKNALAYLIGMIISPMILYLVQVIPPWGYLTSIFLLGLGALILSIALSRDPKLLFILKLKVFRLTVINSESGIEMFNHNWRTDNELVDSVVFSGMIQGINAIMKESVKAGDVTEIRLSDGILLIDRCQHSPVACVLVAANTTQALIDSFHRFSTQFYLKFQNSFNTPDVSVFSDAKQMIKESFPFIPDYQ